VERDHATYYVATVIMVAMQDVLQQEILIVVATVRPLDQSQFQKMPKIYFIRWILMEVAG